MAPAPTASGATRGSSETDELLVKDASASRGADVRDVDGRGSSAARTAVRVAAVGACALAGVAAVSGDVRDEPPDPDAAELFPDPRSVADGVM